MRHENQRNQTGGATLEDLLNRVLTVQHEYHQEITLRLLAASVAFELSDRILASARAANPTAALIAEIDEFLTTTGGV